MCQLCCYLWRDRKLLDFIENILNCFLKMNEGLIIFLDQYYLCSEPRVRDDICTQYLRTCLETTNNINKQTLGFFLQLFTGPLRLNNNNVLTTTASNAWHLSLMNYFETNVTNWLMDRLKSAHLHHIVFQVDEWLCVCVCAGVPREKGVEPCSHNHWLPVAREASVE